MKRRTFLAGLGALAGLACLSSMPDPEPKLYSVGGDGFATHQEALDAMYAEQGPGYPAHYAGKAIRVLPADGGWAYGVTYPDIGARPS